MPFVTPELTCNLQWRHQTRQVFFVKQGDFNSRKVALQLYDGSNRFTWQEGAYTAEFAYRRSDGHGRAYSQINGTSAISLNPTSGMAIVLLEPEALAIAGMMDCELRLLNEGSRLATFTFFGFVEQSVVNDSTPAPTPGPEPTPTPAAGKTKFFGFASTADYMAFVAENPGVLTEGDIVIITSTSGSNTVHTFYVLVTGSSGLELTSRYVITVPTSGSSGTSQIADGAITTAKLAASAVTAAKIGSGAVTEAKIGTGAVTSGKIGASAVIEAKIADKAVTKAKLAQAVQNTLDGALQKSAQGDGTNPASILSLSPALVDSSGAIKSPVAIVGTITRSGSAGSYSYSANLSAIILYPVLQVYPHMEIKAVDYAGRECKLINPPTSDQGSLIFYTLDKANSKLVFYTVDNVGRVTMDEVAIGGGSTPSWQDILPAGGIPATDLAASAKPLIVTIASDGQGGYTTDTSETDILAAVSAGRVVLAQTPYGRMYYGNDDDGASFYGLAGPSNARSIPRFNIDGTTVTYSTFTVPSSGGSGISWASAPTAQQAGYVLVANNDGTASWVSVTNWQTGGSY